MKKKQSKDILLYFVFSFVFNMAANFVHPVTPTIILELGLSDYMFGLAFAAMSLCNFLFSPFWGRLNDFIGTRRSMLIGGIGYAIGQVFFGLAKTEVQFVFARMFAGIFIAASYVCFLTYIVNRSDDESRARNLTINAILQTVSTAAGYFVGGLIGEKGPMYSVQLQIVTLAVSAFILFLVMHEDAKEDIRSIGGKELIAGCNPFSAFAQCARFMTPTVLIFFVYFALISLGFTAFDQCFNYYIRDMFGLTSAYNGIIKAVLGIISLISNLTICMWMIKKKRSTVYIVWILAVCTISMLGVVLSASVIPFIAVNVLFFAFYYVSVPITQDIVTNIAPKEQSNLVMGAYNAIKNFGCIFGALFSGFIYVMDPRMPFIFGFVAFLLAAICSALYLRFDKAPRSE